MKESEFLLGVNFMHSASGLQDEVIHNAGVLWGDGVVHGALDENAFSDLHRDSLNS